MAYHSAYEPDNDWFPASCPTHLEGTIGKEMRVVWMAGRDMHVCRVCGHLFAYRWPGARYCSSTGCQAEKKRRRRAAKPKLERGNSPSWAGVRTAELDAKAALAELRAWMAQECAKW
jgi:hypothetical protein